MNEFIFTSESVSEGHPDKVCDQISDAILDAHLRVDKDSRVACETLVTTGQVVVGGEIKSNQIIQYEPVIRDTIKKIGYNVPGIGFDGDSCGVLVALHEQSADISQGVTEGEGLHKEQGAGDQGIMFGYATNETPELMPATLQYSHSLLKNMAQKRKDGTFSWMRPDSKSQVSIVYKDNKPSFVDTVVISTQHSEDISLEDIKQELINKVVKDVIPSSLLSDDTKYHINPTGQFIIGGPHGDAGLTGRKIIVDTYGGWGAHGGGAFSGKDPSKVDRSAAYYARYMAKNIVAAGLADRVLVQLAYAIGVPYPISIYLDTYGTESVDKHKLQKAVETVFDARPKAIIDSLDLLKPIYSDTAAYGHFGREAFSWEKTDKIEELKKAL